MTEPVTLPIEVNASAVYTVIATTLRYGLTALGGVLVSKGFLTQGVADQAVDQLLGLGLVLLPAIWGIVRAKLTHAKLVTTAAAAPNSVAVVK